MTTTTTLKTKLHHYRFNVSKPAERKAYDEMVATINRNGIDGRGKWMKAWGGTKATTSKAGTTEEVEIDPSCVFENQWNETDESGNRRLFDWFEEAIFVNGRENTNIKQGHWLEITPEMVEVRKATRKCGYCGHHYGPYHGREVPANEMCVDCLDSPYLKQEDLHLLRLLPLTGHQERDKLNDSELAEILPAYVERQTIGKDSRAAQKLAQQRADTIKEYESDTRKAKTEYEGKLWILDQGMTLDNVIYYSHTDKFSFGWRTPVGGAVLSKLLDIISEFHFQYEIKTDDGRTLTNAVDG